MRTTRGRLGPRRVAAALAILTALATCVTLAPVAQAQYQYTRFGKNKVIYKDFDWHVYHAPHFDVHYYPEEEQFLEQVVSYAESAYLYLSKALDHEPKFRIPFIMYLNHGDFEQTNVILDFIEEGVGAFAEPLERRMVVPIDQPPDFLYKLIVHELTHIFEYSILFQDSTGRALRANPPGWLMEGLASYMAKDESNLDKMIIRDAIVNGLVPPITKVQGTSYLVYRYGHAVFDFIEKEFGPEAIRTFLTEYRKILLYSNVDKAIKETFAIDADEFDRRFKRYLVKKDVPLLLENNEPEDHGREIGDKDPDVYTFSPALSPSGELVAVLSNKKDDLDILILNAKDGEEIRNLTKGLTNEYDHLIAAIFSGKNDLSWSPDGDSVAVFARKENRRLLLLFNAVTGKQVLKEVMDVDEAESPAFSPDGKRVAFAGNKGGQVDIFEYNLETKALTNITNDTFYDSNPSWSPDGKTILYNRRINAYEKIFLLDYEDPAQKTQVTFGETSDIQPSYSRDGKRIYYASDAGPHGIFNIYSLDLDTGEVKQYTNLISGALSPHELPEQEGKRRLVATEFWRLSFRLYTVELDQPVEVITPEQRAQEPQEIVPFEPPLKLTVDEPEKRPYDKLKFHVETTPVVGVGVASDGTVLGQAYLEFADLLGDHRIYLNLTTVGNFSNVDVGYWNRKRRLQWVTGFSDYRDFILVETSSGALEREESSRITSLQAGLVYPVSSTTRLRAFGGVMNREIISSDLFIFDDPNSSQFPHDPNISGDFAAFFSELEKGTSPFVSLGIVNDTTRYKSFGPWHGKRAFFSVTSVPTSTGNLEPYSQYTLDFRAYHKITSRSLIAWRLFSAISEGAGASIFSFGGFDQLRGYGYREFIGDSAAFTNIELRYPLVDEVRFPFGSIRQVRGLFFLDVGAAWTQDGYFFDREIGLLRKFKFYDSDENRLQDGRASYGIGFSFRMGFFELNWNFAKRLPFAETKDTFACDTATNLDEIAAGCVLAETDGNSWKSDFYISYAPF